MLLKEMVLRLLDSIYLIDVHNTCNPTSTIINEATRDAIVSIVDDHMDDFHQVALKYVSLLELQ